MVLKQDSQNGNGWKVCVETDERQNKEEGSYNFKLTAQWTCRGFISQEGSHYFGEILWELPSSFFSFFLFLFFLTVVFIRFFIIYLFISSEMDIFSFPVSLPPFLNRIQFLIKRDKIYIYIYIKREKDRNRLHASMRQLR